MSKDVDLSSKEWRDLVFEGKNHEYGAYELRRNSDKRHNKAMLIIVIILALILGAYFTFKALPDDFFEPEIKDQGDQVMTELMSAEDEAPQEEEQQKVELDQPQALPEEVLNTVKVTELLIAQDNEVTKDDEVKSADELKESTTAFGHKDFDKGTDDRNVIKEHKEEIIVEEKKPVVEKEQVFKAVEQMPQFPGGEKELAKWLQKNIQYPTMAQENNIQGRVIVQFVVTKTGAIGEVKIAKSVDRDLDNEAKRLVKKLPHFIPGKMNGQPVNVWFTLPVNFKLQ